ncbi:MAG: tetratricopeptide repeat protein [Pseudomonadota bacterium]
MFSIGRRLCATLIVVATAACTTTEPISSPAGDYLSGRLAARERSVRVASDEFAAALAQSGPVDGIVGERAFFLHLAAGDFDRAVPLAQRLVAAAAAPDAEPTDGLPELTLAIEALRLGDFAAARARLEGADFRRYLPSVAFLVDVWVEDGLNGPQAAIERLSAVPDGVFPSFNPLHNAFLAEKAGAEAAAGAAYEVSLRSFGGPVARRAYGAFLEREGKRDAAEEFYRLLRREPGPSRRAARAGLRRLARGQTSTDYAEVAPAQGAAVAIYGFAGVILDQINEEYDRSRAVGFEPDEPRYEAPLALAQLAIRLDPAMDEARRLAGLIFATYGDDDAARAVLAPIPPTSPQYEQARVSLAQALVRQEKPDEAIALLRRTTARDRNAEEARLALSTILSNEGRQTEAVEVLSGLIERADVDEDDAWRFFVARGAALLTLDRWEAAERDLIKAVDVAPEEPTALNYLGYSWAERGENLDEAFALIEKAVALSPDNGAIVDSLGWAHYQRGDYAEAVVHLERAASMEPADPTITDHLGDVYWRLGRRVEARYQWRHALDLEPDAKLLAALEEKIAGGLAVRSEDGSSDTAPAAASERAARAD